MIPKFRAWDKMRMEWAVPFFIYSQGGFFTPDYGFKVKRYRRTNVYPIVKQERFVLMQSTGVLDKNGVEIFDGDIVNVCDETLKRVFFSCGAFCIDFPSYGTPLHVYGSNQLEVVGNIYENPELMEDPSQEILQKKENSNEQMD